MPGKQLYWEDVLIGSELPALAKVATTQMLVKWAGAIGDFNPLHYDETFAATEGVGQVIVHGPLKRAWLVQMVMDWMGEEGFLKMLSCQFRAMDYPRRMRDFFDPQPGETWRCRGRVTKKYLETGAHCVDCDIWIENGRGEVTTPGLATVVLPSKERRGPAPGQQSG
ncbi:MAG: MaoC/PaaZ C-terminal domain-containing protein [Dehalococcoidales bacterium]|nr:MaoC/PaaZ C-terminal domain-containing protein [Dehalococcoidales bacterium]